MAEANYDLHKWPDPAIAIVNMGSPNRTAQLGDWLVWSGGVPIAAASATAYYRISGIGIALMNNPQWNSQGSGFYVSAMPVGIGGTFHVTGVGSATAGYFVFPMDIGSGVVGQTGLSGQAAIWTALAEVEGFPRLADTAYATTAAPGSASASGFSAYPGSGVGRIMRIYTAADPTAEWEIQLLPVNALGYFLGGAPRSGY